MGLFTLVIFLPLEGFVAFERGETAKSVDNGEKVE